MAIKVTGTTVINDSRKIENVNGFNQVIRKPTITSPTDGATDTANDLTITGSAYAAVYSGTRDYREFQIDLDTGDFSTPVRTNQVDADSWTVSPDLDNEESYKVRIRDVDVDGNVSEFSDVVGFTTAADPFGTLGTATSGGFYMGAICAAGTCYYLIVAPNATGCACCALKTSNTSSANTCSLNDGFANTYFGMSSNTHPAGYWTATRTIGGFSDWYLPAIDELQVFYDNGGGANTPDDPLPSGEDFAATRHWSSTECNVNPSRGFDFDFDNGLANCVEYKTTAFKVRAVRRVPV